MRGEIGAVLFNKNRTLTPPWFTSEIDSEKNKNYRNELIVMEDAMKWRRLPLPILDKRDVKTPSYIDTQSTVTLI
jgi:hypothetical protein